MDSKSPTTYYNCTIFAHFSVAWCHMNKEATTAESSLPLLVLPIHEYAMHKTGFSVFLAHFQHDWKQCDRFLLVRLHAV